MINIRIDKSPITAGDYVLTGETIVVGITIGRFSHQWLVPLAVQAQKGDTTNRFWIVDFTRIFSIIAVAFPIFLFGMTHFPKKGVSHGKH